MSVEPKSFEQQFWWQFSNYHHISPYTYPEERIQVAYKKLMENPNVFFQKIQKIVDMSHSKIHIINNILFFIQDATIHNPVFQPAIESIFYKFMKNCISKNSIFLHYVSLMERRQSRLIFEPNILLMLGDARCGQAAHMLCSALNYINIKAHILQLDNHIVTEAYIDNTSYIFDVDLFKNHIIPKGNNLWLTSKEIFYNPEIINKFKHTGWIFRRNSIYTLNQKLNKIYQGYIDFFSPEIDGLPGYKYGSEKKLLPPGIPKWIFVGAKVTIKKGEPIIIPFEVDFSERAIHYHIKIGRVSKRYSYDCLNLSTLACETEEIIHEFITKEKYIEFRLNEKGIFYITVASIPYFKDKNDIYIWWSDELECEVS